MANLQYIGARYVPKFYINPDDNSNDWKSGVDYEALTIVTYNNDSYTSKKIVPDTVGNPHDNPEYWACTTKYTAALQSVQTTVQNIEDFIGDVPLETNAQTLSGGINEISDFAKFVESISSDNAKFVFGAFSSVIYQNGLCYDGTYFYFVLSDTSGVNPAKIWKLDRGGNKIAELDLGSGHLSSVVYNKNDGFLYVVGSSTTLLKVDTALTSYSTISLNVSGIRNVGWYNDNLYVVSVTNVYRLDGNYNVIKTYPVNLPTVPSEWQGCKIYKNYLVITCNYPNTLIVFDYVNDIIVKTIALGGYIDGVAIGEIQEADVIEINGTLNLFVSATRSTANRFYNKVFIFAGDFSVFPEKRNAFNYHNNVEYYVDGNSSAFNSLGTQLAPFKSLLECCEHLYYNGSVTLRILHTNATIDDLTGLLYVPSFTGTIYIESIESGHFSYFRFTNSQLDIRYKASGNNELSFSQCTATIDLSGSADADTALTITNRASNISVDGNLFHSYNVSGITTITGNLTTELGDHGLTKANLVKFYGATSNALVAMGNGLRYQKSISFTGAGTIRLSAPNVNTVIMGLLSFTSGGSASANRTYFVRGYGSGGSARMAIGLLPPDTDNGVFTPTIDPNANAIDFVNSYAGASIRCTYTALGYDPAGYGDAVEIELTFTP